MATFALTDEVARVRDRAIAIVARCAQRAEPGVQYAAAQALQDWLQGYDKLNPELLERWVPQLEKESQALSDSFTKVASTTSHLPVRAAIEQQGWRLWVYPEESFAQRMGGRLLRSLPADAPYALWKALHEDTLPVTTVAPDESIVGKSRREHFLALTSRDTEPVKKSARALFDELDLPRPEGLVWPAIFTSVLQAQPQHGLQPKVDVYLEEFVVRHPAEAWSLVTETLAEGPLRAILPKLLTELRRHDSTRWHEMVQQARPETHLFDAVLRALWVSSDLSPAELAMVTQGLDLDDVSAVHRSAQTLLDVPSEFVAQSLRSVFTVLRTLPGDGRLWELSIDAFVRWGKPVMSAPPEDEPSAAVRAVAGELLLLLRTSGAAVDWSAGPHTRGLAAALAIIAVAVPHTFKAWMREVWLQPDHVDRSDSLLSASWLSELARLVAESPARVYWQKQFLEWAGDESALSVMGARGLAEMGER
jgi:hypothetical protein